MRLGRIDPRDPHLVAVQVEGVAVDHAIGPATPFAIAEAGLHCPSRSPCACRRGALADRTVLPLDILGIGRARRHSLNRVPLDRRVRLGWRAGAPFLPRNAAYKTGEDCAKHQSLRAADGLSFGTSMLAHPRRSTR